MTNLEEEQHSHETATIATEEDSQPPIFEIASAHIADTEGTEKKYVIYTLQIRHISITNDFSPAILERRYTDFYNLYTLLKSQQPDLMVSINFPRKVLTGNFDNKLISHRSTCFELLLRHILSIHKLRYSSALLSFLQDIELNKVKKYLADQNYATSLPLLENNFRLLNKVYTDRTPAVLMALCRLVGCCVLMPGSPNAEKWADIALHRYEGVCDSDLLELYLPLLNVCSKIWWQIGKNRDVLENRLKDMKLRGINFNESISLLDAVNLLEAKIGNTA